MKKEKVQIIRTTEPTTSEDYGEYLGKKVIDYYFDNVNIENAIFESEEEKTICAIEMIQTIKYCLNLPINIEIMEE